jgi:hypothetical protein
VGAERACRSLLEAIEKVIIAMEDRIKTLHPDGKQGVSIRRDKYEQVRRVILDTLYEQDGITFDQLVKTAEASLQGNFEGSIPWYVTTVKLDLEARGDLKRIVGTRPQRLTLLNRSEI